jgi:type I restriction enzyme S subunit
MTEYSLLIDRSISGWKNYQLDDICTNVHHNYIPSSSGSRLYLGLEHLAQGLPLLVGRGTESDVKSNKSVFKADDILFGKLRPYLKKCVIIEEDGICSTDILVLRANELINPRLLCYLFHTDQVIGYAKATTSGVQHPRTSWNALRNFRLSLPPIDEQNRIANILNIVMIMIQQEKQLVSTIRELQRSLMYKLYSEGIHGCNLQNSEIGLIPEGWKVGKLGDSYKIGQKKAGKHLSQPIPFIPMNLLPIGKNEIKQFEFHNKKTSGTYVENGDLLLAKITPSFENGKQGILNIPYDNGIATTEVIPINEINNKSSLLFIHYYLLIPEIRSILAGKMEGTTGRQRLSKAVLNELLIPLPYLEEQVEIGNILKVFDDECEILENKIRFHENLFHSMLHELITGQICVNNLELDTAQ